MDENGISMFRGTFAFSYPYHGKLIPSAVNSQSNYRTCMSCIETDRQHSDIFIPVSVAMLIDSRYSFDCFHDCL